MTADVDEHDQLNLFCYGVRREPVTISSIEETVLQAVEPSVSLFWASAAMKLDLASTNYEVYLGPNVTSVVELAKMSESEWFYSRMPWRSKEFKVSPLSGNSKSEDC